MELGGDLRRLLSAGEVDGRHVLRKLWRLPRRLAALPERLARGVLRLPRRGSVSDEEDTGRGGKSLA